MPSWLSPALVCFLA
ncbi:hypothetical protein CSHISOI_11370 [Colletotrichum shisoi]|uniref:Uncharacterized protein n=1 Tax=Colletotrichum shisoi TaxID=2078593 RepID=A0A5Q4BAU7_9PEZI|nr:hypothetical protein CSHISOI_11370 [Colletotrichum shisoi]